MTKIKKHRKYSGIAAIIALIFSFALLYISTDTSQKATIITKNMADSGKSRQAYINARSAVQKALYYYNHAEDMEDNERTAFVNGQSIYETWKMIPRRMEVYRVQLNIRKK